MRRLTLDLARVRAVTVFGSNATSFILGHELGSLVLRELTTAPHSVALPVVQRIGATRAVRLDGPTSIGSWFNCYLRFARHLSSPPAAFDVGEGMPVEDSSLSEVVLGGLQSNSVNTASSR